MSACALEGGGIGSRSRAGPTRLKTTSSCDAQIYPDIGFPIAAFTVVCAEGMGE